MVSTVTVEWTCRKPLIGQRLRNRRVELGLTQRRVVEQLAQSSTRLAHRTVSSMEHGAGLDVDKLLEIAPILDCTFTYLLGLTDDPHSWVPDRHDGVPAAGNGPYRRVQEAEIHSGPVSLSVPGDAGSRDEEGSSPGGP